MFFLQNAFYDVYVCYIGIQVLRVNIHEDLLERQYKLLHTKCVSQLPKLTEIVKIHRFWIDTSFSQ